MKSAKRHRVLYWFLLAFGTMTLLAFAATAMPGKWMIVIAEAFGVEDFPKHPLTWYLARHLSVIYGLLGIAVILLARDIRNYQPLILRLGWGIVILGVLQWFIGMSAPMPASWTWSESVSTAIGGVVIVYLARE